MRMIDLRGVVSRQPRNGDGRVHPGKAGHPLQVHGLVLHDPVGDVVPQHFEIIRVTNVWRLLRIFWSQKRTLFVQICQ